MEQRLDEFKRQHLEFVQSAINRMASNSFQIKGFTIGMATILGALYKMGESNHQIWGLLFLVTVISAMVDAYYLQLEGKYRELYTQSVGHLDDSTTSLKELYDMDVSKIKKSYLSCFFSRSIMMPYGLILTIIIVAALMVHGSCLCPQ